MILPLSERLKFSTNFLSYRMYKYECLFGVKVFYFRVPSVNQY